MMIPLFPKLDKDTPGFVVAFFFLALGAICVLGVFGAWEDWSLDISLERLGISSAVGVAGSVFLLIFFATMALTCFVAALWCWKSDDE